MEIGLSICIFAIGLLIGGALMKDFIAWLERRTAGADSQLRVIHCIAWIMAHGDGDFIIADKNPLKVYYWRSHEVGVIPIRYLSLPVSRLVLGYTDDNGVERKHTWAIWLADNTVKAERKEYA